MIEFVNVNEIRPADYNPRRIGDEDFASLCESLRKLGIIVPVIVNRKNGVIVAGHQRTKAAKAIGMETVPVLYAENVSLSDEVVFNQIHNGTDFDQGITTWVERQDAEGWTTIPPEDNHAVCEKRTIVAEVAKLLTRYGNVLSCVVTRKGEVFKSAAYAEACRVLNIPANAYVVGEDVEEFAKKAFESSYGVFSYDHLEKTTWVQGMAQLQRRPTKAKIGGVSKRTGKSRLYEQLVIPNVTKDMRVLDFGAGKGQYAAMLNDLGYRFRSIEFYHNNRKGVNVAQGKRDIEGLIKDVRQNGLFDAVVCDSVLNSVDSMDAERAVIGSCSALLKPGGKLFFSGRPMDAAKKMLNFKKQVYDCQYLYFLDENGFSATFRNGCFYYQKFHSDDQVRQIIAEHGFTLDDFRKDNGGWRCMVTKEEESPHAEFGIGFEFSLPYPGGRYEYAEKMAQALAECPRLETFTD